MLLWDELVYDHVLTQASPCILVDCPRDRCRGA